MLDEDIESVRACVATGEVAGLLGEVGFAASELMVVAGLDQEAALEMTGDKVVLASSFHDPVVISVSVEIGEEVTLGVGLVSVAKVNVLAVVSHNVGSRETLVDASSDLVDVVSTIVLGLIVVEFDGFASSHGGSVTVVEEIIDEMDEPAEPEDFVEKHTDEVEQFQAPRDVIEPLFVREKEVVGGTCGPVEVALLP